MIYYLLILWGSEWISKDNMDFKYFIPYLFLLGPPLVGLLGILKVYHPDYFEPYGKLKYTKEEVNKMSNFEKAMHRATFYYLTDKEKRHYRNGYIISCAVLEVIFMCFMLVYTLIIWLSFL